jgi:pyruvate,water dikinase
MAKILLKGIGASPGTIEGVAKLFHSGDNPSIFKSGEILVTTLTDPTMATVMIKATAIITDIGGITSHPAILSREMGIPCVVNTKDATKKIKNGMKIRVDGQKGKIYVLD